jgi:uncharacterized membrane protein YhaH (DUF805 family)
MKTLLGYLSFRGRANRQRYWATQLLLVGLLVAAMMLSFGMMDIAPLFGMAFLPLLLCVVIAMLANGARRLHDRGKSSWWLLLFMGVPGLLSIFAALGVVAGGSREVADFINALGLPLSIWWLIEMGCLKGAAGPNEYGEDPLQPASEVFA